MVEIVQDQPAYRDRPQIVEAGRIFPLHPGVSGMVGKGNERLKSSCPVLKFSQSQQMVNPVGVIFDMTVKHGGICPDPCPMRGLHHVKPSAAGDLFRAEPVPDALIEYLCPS